MPTLTQVKADCGPGGAARQAGGSCWTNLFLQLCNVSPRTSSTVPHPPAPHPSFLPPPPHLTLSLNLSPKNVGTPAVPVSPSVLFFLARSQLLFTQRQHFQVIFLTQKMPLKKCVSVKPFFVYFPIKNATSSAYMNVAKMNDVHRS